MLNWTNRWKPEGIDIEAYERHTMYIIIALGLVAAFRVPASRVLLLGFHLVGGIAVFLGEGVGCFLFQADNPLTLPPRQPRLRAPRWCLRCWRCTGVFYRPLALHLGEDACGPW